MKKELDIPIYMLGFLFFMAPLLTGMYKEPYLFLGILVPLGVVLYCAASFSFERSFSITIADALALILFAAYLISTLAAGDMHEALIFDLKLAGGLALYFWFRVYRPSSHFIENMGIVLFSSAVVCSLISWVCAVGVIDSTWIYKDNVIQTTLGYKNTGALFLSLALYLGMWMFLSWEKRLTKVLIMAGACLVFITLLGTQSRAVWLLFAFLALVSLWLFRDKIILVIVYYLSIILPSTVTGFIAVNKLIQGNGLMAIFLVLVTILLSIIIGLFFCFILQKKTSRNAWFIIAAFVMLGMAIGITSLDLSGYVQSKFSTISFSDASLRERAYFLQDAFKIIKDHMWFGTGGQGWDAYYLGYQTYAYYAENIHNTYIQTFLEAGVFGFIAFIGLWAVLLYYSLIKRPKSPFVKVLALFLWMLSMHSVMDFDMSFGAISILFWFSAAVMVNNGQAGAWEKSPKEKTKNFDKIFRGAITALCTVLIIITGVFVMASFYYDRSKVVLGQGDVHKSIAYLEKSLSLDPYNINTLVRLSQLNLQLSSYNPLYLEESIKYGERAVQVKLTEPMGHYVLGSAYMSAGRFDSAVLEFEQQVKYHPNLLAAYENLAEIYLTAAMNALQTGEQAKAQMYLRKIPEVVQQVDAKSRSYSQDVLSLWKDEPVLKISDKLSRILEKSESLIPD